MLRRLSFSCSLCIAISTSADREVGEGGLRVKVQGRSGGLRIVRESGRKRRDISKNDGVLVVEIDYIKQKNEQGRDVGKLVSTLANQDFSIAVNKSANYQGELLYNLSL